MTPMTMMNSTTGLIEGRVTQRKRCHAPAPSSAADSCRCLGTSRTAARKMIIAFPRPQTARIESESLRPVGRLEPERPLDADLPEERVHGAGRGVQQVHEPERRRDRRCQGREVEDRPVDPDAPAGAGEHDRDAEGEERPAAGPPRRRTRACSRSAGQIWRSVVNDPLVVAEPDPGRVGRGGCSG